MSTSRHLHAEVLPGGGQWYPFSTGSGSGRSLLLSSLPLPSYDSALNVFIYNKGLPDKSQKSYSLEESFPLPPRSRQDLPHQAFLSDRSSQLLLMSHTLGTPWWPCDPGGLTHRTWCQPEGGGGGAASDSCLLLKTMDPRSQSCLD